MKPVLSAAFLVAMEVSTFGTTQRYVSLNGTNDAANGYNTWAGAATQIEAAVNIAVAGDTIWVSNGVFNITNHLQLNKAYTLIGFNGRDKTIINGQRNIAKTSGWHVRMSGNAVFAGLTISNGFCGDSVEAAGLYSNGGAAISNARITHCYSLQNGSMRLLGGTTSVTNCIFENNEGTYTGVNISQGLNSRITVSDCLVANNKGTPIWLTQGTYAWAGPAQPTLISHCVFTNNGGTAYLSDGGIVRNCLFIKNKNKVQVNNFQDLKIRKGGSAGEIVNCTIAGNYSTDGGLRLTGTNNPGTLINCIVYSNFTSSAFTTSLDVSMDNPVHSNAFWYCCLPNELPANQYCMTSTPRYADYDTGNFRLHQASPCLNAGTTNAQSWMAAGFDMDRNPRIMNGRVDMGAYETYFARGTVLLMK